MDSAQCVNEGWPVCERGLGAVAYSESAGVGEMV